MNQPRPDHQIDGFPRRQGGAARCKLLATLLIALLTAATSLAPASASAATPGEAIARLDQQRTANGIPAAITERLDWSSACARHNEYQRSNDILTHDEEPGRPGYTEEGAWAGRNSVLAAGSTWNGANPFEDAPIHLAQLLAPRLSEMGVDDSGGYVCATTWPGMNRPAPAAPAVYTYPGDGRLAVPYAQTAAEDPFVPGDFVGLPQGTRTGPNMLVFADGPWSTAEARIDAASLTGPDGPVEVRWVDNTTEQIGPYLPTAGVVIPVRPLGPSSVYTASIRLSANGQAITHTWSFTTVAASLDDAPPPIDEAHPRGQRRAGQWLRLARRRVRAGRPLVINYRAQGRGVIAVRLVRRGRVVTAGRIRVGRGRARVLVPTGRPGRYRLRVTLKTARMTRLRARVRVGG